MVMISDSTLFLIVYSPASVASEMALGSFMGGVLA